MPIHDQGYRRYAGARAARGRSWWVIARAGVVARLRERRFLALLLIAWAPFLVRAVQIYVSETVPQAQFLALSSATFRQFFDQQSLFVFLVTIYVGSGLVADDRRSNALQIYLSRPLTRVEYLGGKLVTVAVFLLGVTWLPAMLLLLLQVVFAGSLDFIRGNAFLIPAITVYSAVQVLVSALAILAVSSLSRSRRFVAIMYAGILFFTAAFHQVLRAITGSEAWAWISPGDTFGIVADRVFRVEGASPIPLPAALLALAALAALSIWILARRVRAVEVVT